MPGSTTVDTVSVHACMHPRLYLTRWKVDGRRPLMAVDRFLEGMTRPAAPASKHCALHVTETSSFQVIQVAYDWELRFELIYSHAVLGYPSWFQNWIAYWIVNRTEWMEERGPTIYVYLCQMARRVTREVMWLSYFALSILYGFDFPPQYIFSEEVGRYDQTSGSIVRLRMAIF